MSKIIQADFNGQAMRFTADGWFNATGRLRSTASVRSTGSTKTACGSTSPRWLTCSNVSLAHF